MDEIDLQRKKIDSLDRKLVALLAERMLCARVIGRVKRNRGLLARDSAREKVVLEKISAVAAKFGLDRVAAQAVFQKVMDESVALQQNAAGKIVAFQGERGAYSEQAVLMAFGDCLALPCVTVADALKAAKDNVADAAVLPIENSIEGPVVGVIDLLQDTTLSAVRELYLPVRHCLMALPGQKIEGITQVLSHPQALAQCGKMLSRIAPNARLVPAYDTAGAARMVSEKEIAGAAAIAGESAAKLFGLEILARDLQDDPANTTRFLVFSKGDSLTYHGSRTLLVSTRGKSPANADKTTIIFGLRNVPGALLAVFRVFAAQKINVSRIDSRPLRNTPWEYSFCLDFEAGAGSPEGRAALEMLKKVTTLVKVVGSYPNAKLARAK